MSWVQVTGADGQNKYVEEEEFHRVNLTHNDVLLLRATEKPVALWVPAGYEVYVKPTGSGVVLDVAEVVQHEDIVSMDEKLREAKREVHEARRKERRNARRLRRQERERPSGPPEPA